MRRLTSLVLSALMALAFLFVGPGAAHAVAPLPSLDELTTDQAGVLEGEPTQIAAAQANFHEATGGQFYVVFIDSFDGMDPDDWAEATAQNAGLTSTDILIVVAPAEGQYRINHGGDFVFTDAQARALEGTMGNSLGSANDGDITWQAAIANIIGAFQNEVVNESLTPPMPEGSGGESTPAPEGTDVVTEPAGPGQAAETATGGLPTVARVVLIVLGALAALFALWLLLGKYNEKRLAKRAEQNPFNL